MLKILLITIILVAFVMLALSVKMLFDKKAKFTGSSCNAAHDPGDKNIGCGCGNTDSSCKTL